MTVLTETRELLANPHRWTKGVLASKPTGLGSMTRAAHPSDESATCFCLDGALMRVVYAHTPVEESTGRLSTPARAALKAAVFELFPKRVAGAPGPVHIDFNDSRMTTHKELLKVIDRAIEIEAERAKA